MDPKSFALNVCIPLAMGGVCALVVGMALGGSGNGTLSASVVFNAGVFALVLTLAMTMLMAKFDARRAALVAGMSGALSGLVVGASTPFLLIASVVALAGAAVAVRHPRAGICLMLVPAVGGWLEEPSIYSIPARVLMGASLVLLVHLLWVLSYRQGTALKAGADA